VNGTSPPGQNGPRSLVAGANALFRANESLRAPGDRILNDPFASLFAEGDPRVAAIRFARFAVPSLGRMIEELQAVHCIRHRSIDELVLRAIADGFEQVVVVGAGYDMRPLRFADRAAGVRWFEVDHPATSVRKLQRLATRSLLADHVERVAADLQQTTLQDALARTRFSAERPTCIVMEGLVHYLSPSALEASLRDAAHGPGRRRLILSYIRTDMYEQAPGRPRASRRPPSVTDCRASRRGGWRSRSPPSRPRPRAGGRGSARTWCRWSGDRGSYRARIRSRTTG